MTLAIIADPVPLVVDDYGTIRIKGSRVTLDTIVAAFNKGYTPTEIQIGFDTLTLADIYAVISYYLHHQTEVETYLAQQETLGAEIRRKIEVHSNNSNIRERLLARLATQQKLD
jgi:uncharacterized protein (DUF433 family)